MTIILIVLPITTADGEIVNYYIAQDSEDILINNDEILEDALYYKYKENKDNITQNVERNQNTPKYDLYNSAGTKANNGVLGCDVSKWQGNIDWNKAKSEGINYTIIRVAYRGRTNGKIYDDPCYEANIKNALEAGIQVGVYFYSEAITTAEAVEEANYLISKIYKYNITLPLVIDYEGFNSSERIGQANLSKAQHTSIVSAFCDTVQNAGYAPMIYASASYFETYMDGLALAQKYRIWSAAYSHSPDYYNTVPYDFWQFTSSADGKKYGMQSEGLDLDYWYNNGPISSRNYGLVFDADYYYKKYPDVANAFGNNSSALLNHFLKYGMKEGRIGNSSFDIYSYRGRYADLEKKFGTNWEAYYTHYLEKGKNEGRDGSPDYSTYTVNFISDGTIVKTETVTFGHPANAPTISKNGYTYTWDKAYSCVTSDINVNAVWKGNSYTVSYNANGGSVSTSSKTVTMGTAYGTLITPVRMGYTFLGWYTAADGGTKVEESTLVTLASNHTLYAHWTPNTYTVSFDANKGNTSTPSKVLTYGKQYGNLPTPTKAGYSFLGWWTAVDGGKQITSTTVMDTASNHTLYAHWKLNSISVSYQTHVQNIGWQDIVKDGAVSGTTGKSLQLEGIKINLDTTEDLGVIYTTHVQNDGWHNNSFNGELSGTTGQSKRLEAIMIKLTGSASSNYDIYYRVHSQGYGWMAWAKNGEAAGTSGCKYRLEAIQIVVVGKGDSAPGTNYGNIVSVNSNAYITKNFATSSINTNSSVSYQTHVQNIGWQNAVSNGGMSGTSGKALRLESIKINLNNQKYSGGITYQTHVQNIGWQNAVSNGSMSGTSGKALRLEAINISLTGEMAQHYDIYYRVHAQNYGWLGWAKNGQNAGTSGKALRLEAIQIILVEKGGAAPQNNYNGISSNNTLAYISK